MNELSLNIVNYVIPKKEVLLFTKNERITKQKYENKIKKKLYYYDAMFTKKWELNLSIHQKKNKRINLR